jgi:phage gpG-like protein
MDEGFVVSVDTSEMVLELQELEHRGYNMTEVNEQLAQILHVMVEDKFENQGPGWKGFAPSTLRRRRKSTTPHLLQDTGDLVGSLTPFGGTDFAEVFTNKKYARYHLEGDGVEKRDFFDIDVPKALEMFDEIITAEIARGR